MVYLIFLEDFFEILEGKGGVRGGGNGQWNKNFPVAERKAASTGFSGKKLLKTQNWLLKTFR